MCSRGRPARSFLAWLGADVIKVERPGSGDITRGQLRDIPDADSLYFTMMNHNKRSITLDAKNPKGLEVLTALVKACDVLVENYAPGALDRMGLGWYRIQELNPRMILASVKGFGPGPFENCKIYENAAQCVGGAASTTGFRDGPAARDQRADRRRGGGPASGAWDRGGAVSARDAPDAGRRSNAPCRTPCLNLCRVKLRDQQRLARGPLEEYSQFGEGMPFGDTVPRSGNNSGGGQPGRILKCKGWETDPNAYIYFITQAAVWDAVCDVIGEPGWKTHPDYATLKRACPASTKFSRASSNGPWPRRSLRPWKSLTGTDIPCGPILSMKELAEDPAFAQRARWSRWIIRRAENICTVGNPIKMSDSPVGGGSLAAARRAHG